MKLITKCTAIAVAIALTGIASVQAKETVTIMSSVTETLIHEAWDDQIQRYQSTHPDVEVKKMIFSSEGFKQKIQTMLMSKNKPDILMSWGGKNYVDRANKGLLKDLTDHLPTLTKEIPESALQAYRVNGRLYGVPAFSKPTMLYYNKDLLAKAGVKPADLETWEGFLQAVDTLKAAGITPLAIGGIEGWPAHFYYSYLAMRIGGPDIFKKALEEGFNDPAFLRAAEELKRLADKKPWQKGYMSSDINQAYSLFGNSQVAMQLQGEWQYKLQQDTSTSGKGVAADTVGLARFPAIKAGKGQLTDIISGIDGYAFTNSATPTTANFVDFWLNEQNLAQMARDALMLPVNPESAKALEEPVARQMALMVAQSSYVHGFVDQILGAHLGGTINDVSSELVAGTITPKAAVAMLQEAWDFQ